MQSNSSRCYKWLKNLTFTPFQGLICKALDHMSPTSNITGALQLIRNHWGLVWPRPDIDFPHASAAIDREISHLPQVGLAFSVVFVDTLAIIL